jgi:DNA primase
VLKEGGLAHENSRGKMQDVMRERVIFPICDPMGKVIALGGRVLPEELRTNTHNPGPKYRNSPESPIYSKSSTLYGLNWSKAEIAKTHEVIVCEGYTDVIGFSTSGIARAVATCGTSLTESHFRLLSRFAKRVVLSFDQDSAGQNAAARLYEFERRHEVELFVAALPPGSDPGELARSDSEALRTAVTAARPFLGFRVDRALSRFDLATPEGRTHAAEAAISAIAEHPNDLVRDQYIVEVADRTHNDLARLRSLLEAERLAPKQHSDPPPRVASVTDDPWQGTGDGDLNIDQGPVPTRRGRNSAPASRAGRDGLMLAIHRPEEVADWLDEVLFQDPVQRAGFHALCSFEELHQAIDHADPDAQELLRRLVVSDGAAEIDVSGTMIELVRASATRALNDLERDARLNASDPVAVAEASMKSSWLKAELEVLRDPPEASSLLMGAVDGAMRILAWLRETYPVEELR